MSTQIRQPRARGGGRTLMLLGVLLALAAGIIVIYVVTSVAPTTIHTVTVVVAAKDLPPGTLLDATLNDSSHTVISTAFVTKQVNADFAPSNVYPYTNPTQLNVDLQGKLVTSQFYAGDILRASDPRLAKPTDVAIGSVTLKNPAQLPAGSVLFPLPVANLDALALVPGDHIDILATYSVSGGASSGNASGGSSVAQTTLENVYIYALEKGLVYVVLTHEQALELKVISESGQITLVLRKPGDTGADNTVPIDSQYIISHFHFTP